MDLDIYEIALGVVVALIMFLLLQPWKSSYARQEFTIKANRAWNGGFCPRCNTTWDRIPSGSDSIKPDDVWYCKWCTEAQENAINNHI